MFQTARTIILFLALTGIAVAADLPANGVLICCEPPSTYVELIRFNEIREHPVISDIILCSKTTRQIRNNAIIARFDYPQAAKGTLTKEGATATVALAQQMAAKYPEYRAQLTDIATRWQKALSTIKPPKPQTLAKSGPTPKRSTQPKLTVSGVTYSGVKVIGLEDYLIKIEHLEGLARFEILRLTQEEIDAINAIAGGPVISPEDLARAKAAEAAALALAAKQPPMAGNVTRSLATLKSEISSSETELRQIKAQMVAVATAAAKATPTPRQAQGQGAGSPQASALQPSGPLGSRGTTPAPPPNPLEALGQRQQAAELKLIEAKRQVARLETVAAAAATPAAPTARTAATAPTVSMASIASTTRPPLTPNASPITRGNPQSPIPGPASPRIAPTEPDLGIPQAIRPDRTPINLADVKACYQELAELATGPVVVNSSENSRLTILGRFDHVADTLDWVVRSQHLLESPEPALVKTAQTVKNIYLDFLRLNRWEDDFGQTDSGVEPDLLAYLERMWAADGSDYDKQVVIYREGRRDVYTDHDGKGGAAAAPTQRAKTSLEEHQQDVDLSKHVELGRGILFNQLDEVWTREILPQLVAKNGSAAAPLLSIGAPGALPGKGAGQEAIAYGPGFAAVHSNAAGPTLDHCLLAIHLANDLGDRTSWFGYFPKISPTDALLIQTGGIESSALSETSATVNGELSFFSDEGSEPKTAFSWPSPVKRPEGPSNAEVNRKIQAELPGELDLASSLIVHARRLYRPPADPISARAKLMAAIRPGRKYTAYAEDGRPSISFTCKPFKADATLIQAESESAGAGGKGGAALIGRFEEEVSRGCVLALVDARIPDGDRLMSKRLLWLVTEPRELWRMADFRGSKIVACPYVVYLDSKERLAIQRLGSGGEKVSSALLKPD